MWISYTLDPASQYLISRGIPLPKCDAETKFLMDVPSSRGGLPYRFTSQFHSWATQYLWEWQKDRIPREIQALGIWAAIVLLRRWNPSLPEWLTNIEYDVVWEGAEQFLNGMLAGVPYNDFIFQPNMEGYYTAIDNLEFEIDNIDTGWYKVFLRNLRNVFRYWIAVLQKEDQPHYIQHQSIFTVTSAAQAYGIGIFLMTHPNSLETTHPESTWYIFKYACNFTYAWIDYAQKLMIGYGDPQVGRDV